MPVYNSRNFLEKSLGCLKKQSYANFEAIIVDDGSKDESYEYLLEEAKEDSRFKIFHKENGGAASARNMGMKLAKGDFFVFLDADDWLDDDTFEIFISLIKKHDADMVQCRFCYNDASGGQYYPTAAFEEETVLEQSQFPKTIYRLMLTGMQMNHPTHAILKSSLFDGLEMPEHMITAEDLYLMVDIYPRVKRFVYTARPMYHYFRHAGGLTGARLSILTRFKCNIQVAKKMSASLENWGMNNFSTRMLAYLRPVLLIFSKLLRMARNQLMKVGK